MTKLLNYLTSSVKQKYAESCCPALKGHPLAFSLSLKSCVEQTLHWLMQESSLPLISALRSLWGKKRRRKLLLFVDERQRWLKWHVGLWEDTGFSSGTQFLEGMIDAHLCLSVLSVLACLWPCSCHTVDTAREKATLKLQTGLNGPSLSCCCFLTEVNLPAHHKLLPETLADRAAEKLPFVCLWFRLCTKSAIVRAIFSCLILQWIYNGPDWPDDKNKHKTLRVKECTGFMSDLSLFLPFIFPVWKKKSLHHAVMVMQNDICICPPYYGTWEHFCDSNHDDYV